MRIISAIPLNIKFKLIIAFMTLSVIPAILIGFISIISNISSYKEIAINNLSEDLYVIKSQLDNFSVSLEEKINFFTASKSFNDFIVVVGNNDQKSIDKAIEGILPGLLAFTTHSDLYYQIKYIDDRGDEIFLLNHYQERYNLIPEHQLNLTGTKFYLYLVNNISPNTALLLPVEQIMAGSMKPIPTITCIYNVVKSDKSGILVFNIYADKFFELLNLDSPHSSSGNVMLADVNGYYLYQSKIKSDWNKFTAMRHEMNISKDYGKGFNSRLFNKNNDRIFELDDEIIAREFVFSSSNGLNNEHVLLKSVSKSEMFAPVNDFIIFFVSAIAIVLLISFILAIVAAQQFTVPMKILWEKARVIAGGNYKSRVVIESKDEIGDLARQFNRMAESIDKRDEQIQQHQLLLKQKVLSRTKELEEEKNKLQIILDNVPSGLLLINPHGEILSVSATLEKITGTHRAKLVGENHRDVLNKYLNIDAEAFETIFKDGKSFSTEIKTEGTDGEHRYFDCLIVPLKKNGKTTAALEIITDITERNRLYKLFVRSEKLATIGEMSAVIAHEIRNSLTSVRMILELIAHDFTENGTDIESVEVALDSINRLENIINNFLQFSKPVTLQKHLEEINSVIKKSVEFARHQILNKDINIELSLTEEIQTVNFDKDRFYETIINLLLNSFQAIKKKGTVRITTFVSVLDKKIQDIGEVVSEESSGHKEKIGLNVKEVILEKGSKVINIEISDNGVGIDEDNLIRIFDPFFTTKTIGTGLGLSYVKRIVNQHKGIVIVESSLKKGSKFTILLPC